MWTNIRNIRICLEGGGPWERWRGRESDVYMGTRGFQKFSGGSLAGIQTVRTSTVAGQLRILWERWRGRESVVYMGTGGFWKFSGGSSAGIRTVQNSVV